MQPCHFSLGALFFEYRNIFIGHFNFVISVIIIVLLFLIHFLMFFIIMKLRIIIQFEFFFNKNKIHCYKIFSYIFLNYIYNDIYYMP